MHIYYVAGLPYSDELYHHGVKGQKWGIRRYQNEDGTLTTLGKIHYRAQRLGSRIKESIKESNRKRVEAYKKSHPWLMSDEELKSALNRANMERQYTQVVNEVKTANSASYRAKNIVSEILVDGGKTLASKAFEAAGNKLINTQNIKDEKRYSKQMTKQAAKNKLLSDKIIDKGQRKLTRDDASTKVYRKVQKNFNDMSKDDLKNELDKWETLKKMENRFSETQIGNIKKNNGGGGGKPKKGK